MKFNGFNEYTNEYLIGIKFNNNKPWFQAHKDMYTDNVHNPTVALANELYERMTLLDSNFTEKPKVSRANRDIRFTKDKTPYKLCKWFFLKNEHTKGSMPHNAPGYFFEMSADWWRYGIFYGGEPQEMERFRAKISADTAKCERMLKIADNSPFELQGDEYKRVFNKDLSDNINRWANKKFILYVRYEDFDNMDFYSPKLVDTIFNDFKEMYEVYKYFKA